MLTSVDQVQERVDTVCSLVTLSQVSPYGPRGIYNCPACGGVKKLQVYDDRSFHCFKAGCSLGQGRKNVLRLYRLLKGMETPAGFYQALEELEQIAGLPSHQSTRNARSEVLVKALKAYQQILWTPAGAHAREYLERRGISEMTMRLAGIGYAPEQGCLRDYGLDAQELVNQGLVVRGVETFRERIMFPIRDQSGQLIHFTGRYLGELPTDEQGEPLFGRYKDSGGGIKEHLFLEERLRDYSDDLLVIAEGPPDTISLLEASLPAAGMLGLNGLERHVNKLARFKRIIFAFDSDRFPPNHPTYPNQYKSWTILLPKLVQLQCVLAQTEIYLWTSLVPEVKDVNDYLLCMGAQKLRQDILSTPWELISILIGKWGASPDKHQDLLRMIAATGRGMEPMRACIAESDPLSYALQVLQ